MEASDRWRAARSEARFTIRQTLLRAVEQDERALQLATKKGDAIEIQRLTELVEAGRAAVAVLDECS